MVAGLAVLVLSGCGGGGGSPDTPQPTTIHGQLQAGDQRFGTTGPYVVFYSCRARQDGIATVTLHGSTFPPVLEVGTLQGDGSIQEVYNFTGGADNSTNPLGATGTFGVTSGTTYYIAATTDVYTSAGPLPTGGFTLVFSDIFANIQQDNTINPNRILARSAPRR